MKSLAELKKLREASMQKMDIRNTEKDYRVVVGMATCGITAGARPVLNRFVEESAKNGNPCIVAQAGCIGLCIYEPIVEVFDKEGTRTTYVHVNPDKASHIFASHILNGKVVSEYTLEEAKKGE